MHRFIHSTPNQRITLRIALLHLFLTSAIFTNSCSDGVHPCLVRKNVLLYIDLTKTMEQKGVMAVANHAKGIMSALPPGSKLTVKLVDKHSERQAFFERTTNPDMQNVSDEKKAYKASTAQMGDTLRLRILATFDSLQSQNILLHTCLLNTFEEACQFFRAEDSGKFEFHLIYISDMVEQCHSDYGDVNFIRDKKLSVDTLTQRVSNRFNETDLKALIGTNLHFIFASSEETYTGLGILSEQGLRKFWGSTLMQMGYTQDEISGKFNFRTEVPEEFKKLCFEMDK